MPFQMRLFGEMGLISQLKVGCAAHTRTLYVMTQLNATLPSHAQELLSLLILIMLNSMPSTSVLILNTVMESFMKTILTTMAAPLPMFLLKPSFNATSSMKILLALIILIVMISDQMPVVVKE